MNNKNKNGKQAVINIMPITINLTFTKAVSITFTIGAILCLLYIC